MCIDLSSYEISFSEKFVAVTLLSRFYSAADIVIVEFTTSKLDLKIPPLSQCLPYNSCVLLYLMYQKINSHGN
jgi:hypothetical protein